MALPGGAKPNLQEWLISPRHCEYSHKHDDILGVASLMCGQLSIAKAFVLPANTSCALRPHQTTQYALTECSRFLPTIMVKKMTEHSPEETGLLAYFQTQILPGGLGPHLPGELPPQIKG